MARADWTLRWTAWYRLEQTTAGWWVTPCLCLSGLGEPVYVKLARHFGPYPSRARACEVGDLLIEQLEKDGSDD